MSHFRPYSDMWKEGL